MKSFFNILTFLNESGDKTSQNLVNEENIFCSVGKLKENADKAHLPNVPLIIYFINDLMTKRRNTYHK